MKIDIVMPKMGESISEATIIEWHKKKGEIVAKDEILYEISTDKVDTEIPCPDDGVLVDIKAFEQETVEVGTVVAILETDKKAADDELISNSESGNIDKSTTKVGGNSVDIVMPKMGESVMEGTIIQWHKNVGDSVAVDEILFEISTDKVDTEVPSPVEGTLQEILFNENDTVEVGTVVAKISSLGGIVKEEKVELKKENSASKKVMHESKPIQTVNNKENSSNRFYSPLVLNIARKENISFSELETISGSGLKGRVSKKDVLEFLKNRNQQGETTKNTDQKTPQISRAYSSDDYESIPMDKMRKQIMHHMIKSKENSVHVTEVVEVDMTKIYNHIQSIKDEFLKNEGVKITYMPFVSYAVIKALKEFPLMNASLDGDTILQKKFINLGIAVAVEPNGLIVPNIKSADEKSIRGLAKSIYDIGIRARKKALQPDEVADGTFTITNYGVFGALFGTPIINQPEVGILGVGAVVKKPVVIEHDGIDTIAIKPMMFLSLSHDHRLVDGMLGGRFLKSVKERLENFDTEIN